MNSALSPEMQVKVVLWFMIIVGGLMLVYFSIALVRQLLIARKRKIKARFMLRKEDVDCDYYCFDCGKAIIDPTEIELEVVRPGVSTITPPWQCAHCRSMHIVDSNGEVSIIKHENPIAAICRPLSNGEDG